MPSQTSSSSGSSGQDYTVTGSGTNSQVCFALVFYTLDIDDKYGGSSFCIHECLFTNCYALRCRHHRIFADHGIRRAKTGTAATTVPPPATRTRITTPTRTVATTIPTPTVCTLSGSRVYSRFFKGFADTDCKLHLPQRWSGWQHLHPAERRKEVNHFATLASSDRHVMWLVEKQDEHAFVVPWDHSRAD
jgi:hypothetical protein